MVRLKVLVRVFMFAFAFSGLCSQVQPAEPPKANLRELYTKYEYRIPMRDGARLFTVIYAPKDGSKTYPFLVVRTPYGVGARAQGEKHYGVDHYPETLATKELVASGYIFVLQDVRGRYMSEG